MSLTIIYILVTLLIENVLIFARRNQILVTLLDQIFNCVVFFPIISSFIELRETNKNNSVFKDPQDVKRSSFH